MYYKIDNKVYNKEDIAGKTFDETNKPEPLFTLQEMRETYGCAFSDGEYNKDKGYTYCRDSYFKLTYNIDI